MTFRQRLFKRVSAALMVFIFISGMLVFDVSSSRKVKADAVTDLIKAIVTVVTTDGGEVLTFTTNPELGVAMATIGIICGVKFSSKTSYDNFISGFWQWCGQSSFLAAATGKTIDQVKTLFSQITTTSTVSGSKFLSIPLDVIKALRAYVVYLHTNKSVTVTVNQGTYSIAPSSTVNVPITIDKNSTYVISSGYSAFKSGDTIRTYLRMSCVSTAIGDQLMYYTDWQGHFNQTYKFYKIVTYDDYFLLCFGPDDTYQYVNTTAHGITFPLTWNIIENQGGSNVASGFTYYSVTGDSICGDATLANPDASSKDSSISADKPIATTIPSDPAYDDVIGKTATDVATGTGDITATNTADTTATPTTPDWTAPNSKSIDWSPLLDLELFDKFPFCLPWDLKNIVTSLVASPEAPDIKFNIPMSALHLPDLSLEVDFSQYETPVKVIRWGILLIFTGGLIFSMYKIIKH